MAQTLRRITPKLIKMAGRGPLIFLFIAPLVVSIVLAFQGVFNAAAWLALLQHPQFLGALLLSVFTGTAGAFIGLVIATLIIAGLYGTNSWAKLSSLMGGFLALPHLAFAIGFGFLIMPSGLLARGLSATLTGWSAPPNWITTQDPWGMALIATLVLKETPFLIWIMASVLRRDDLAQSLDGQSRVAASLGHGTLSQWLSIILPQVFSRMVGPLIAVWAYGITVVDLALSIGPTQPPTFAVMVWSDINNVDPAINQRGSAGAIFLAVCVGLGFAFAYGFLKSLTPLIKQRRAAGPRLRAVSQRIANILLILIIITNMAVLVSLLLMSFAGHWPFPNLWPAGFRFSAWWQLAIQPGPLILSLLLGAAASIIGLLSVIAWLETTSVKSDRAITFLAMLSLVLPALLLGIGQYRLLLAAGHTGTLVGLFFAHLIPVMAYMFLVLIDPYRKFDPQWRAVACGLGKSTAVFWWRVKIPLLKANILSALAIGFTVSMTQFVGPQLAASGRFSTLAMEAVTLSAGSNRSLTAVFALMQMIPPLLGFLIASLLNRPRKWGV